MITIHDGEIVITTLQDIINQNKPVGFWNVVGCRLPKIAQQLEKCELWIHVDKSGNGVILKDRYGIHYADDSGMEESDKQIDDDFEENDFDSLSQELDEQSTYTSFIEEGKVRINNCVYSMVPASMTMGEFDRITCVLFELIRDAWEEESAAKRRNAHEVSRSIPPDPPPGPPVEYIKESAVKRKDVHGVFTCPSCESELDYVPNDYNPCKCGYSTSSEGLLNKKQLEECVEKSRVVLNKAVGFDHHTLAIAALSASIRIKKLEKELESKISDTSHRAFSTEVWVHYEYKA